MIQESPIAVSVAVITYNMEQYLPQLLDSILMQKTAAGWLVDACIGWIDRWEKGERVLVNSEI